jgi:hypothetical protein
LFLFSFCFIPSFVILTSAQIPPQLNDYRYLQPMHETTVSITEALASHGDMASDGSGHHYVAPNSSGSITHYLFDNVGTLLSSTNFGTTSSVKPAITARNGLIHVTLHNTSSNTIEFWQSSNAGAAWSNPDFRTVQGTLDGLDAFEDDRGVHITYSSSTGIYYHMRDLFNNTWAQYASTVYSGTLGSNISPAITTSSSVAGDSAHVLSWRGLRSFKFPTTTDQGSWVASTAPYSNSVRNSFAIVHSAAGETDFGPCMFVFCEQYAGYNNFNRRYRRYGTTDTWGGPLTPQAGIPNGNPSVVISTGYPEDIDWPNFVFSDIDNYPHYRVTLYRTKASDSEPLAFGRVFVNALEPSGFVEGSQSVAGANQGSVVVMWRCRVGSEQDKLYFRRKPYPIVGDMNENYVLTDTNWVLGTTTLAASKELRLKSGSITYLAGEFSYGGQTRGPGKLMIGDGASLVVESGAKLILQAPTGTFTQGGTIQCGSGVTVTAQGVLEANAGAKLFFGSNSSLVVTGAFTANGTSTKPVILTRSGTSGTWGGIVVDNCNASTPATLTYASLSHCGTGISTRLSAKFGMDHCTLDDMEIGLEIDPTQGDCPSTGFAIEVTNSSFSNISATSILVNSFSNLTLQGNTLFGPESSPFAAPAGITCINASPKLLGNTIKDFSIGLECLSGSAPVLEDGIYGGYNVITRNGTGVLCQDGSNAVLGFLSGNMNDVGGMNSIAKNNDFDVSLINDCSVSAENNWWGSKDDPPGIFDIDGSSKFDYNPWLDSDPNGDSPINGTIRTAGKDDPRMDPMPLIARRALANMGDGHYAEAIQLLRTIFTDSTYESSVRKWAIRMLLVASQHQATPNLAGYLHASLTTCPGLARTIRSVLPFSYLNERTHGEAMASFDVNLEQYPGSELARAALYGKFIIGLFIDRDLGRASRLQAQLESAFPSSTEASLAAIQLRCNQPPGSNTSPIGGGKLMGKKREGSPQLPCDFAFEQNYPNPFNPTTEIRFALPDVGNVSLVVFDVLGRKVADLANSKYEAGYHSAIWNAANQASGVYFARLTVTGTEGKMNYSKINKLLLMK